jgi:hypothetical protein
MAKKSGGHQTLIQRSRARRRSIRSPAPAVKTKENTGKGLSDKAFNEGFQKGNAKKAEELKPHLVDPAERERLKTLEKENER